VPVSPPSLEECWRQICRIGGSDAQIATGYTGFFKKNYEKAIDVVIGTYEEGDYGCIFIV